MNAVVARAPTRIDFGGGWTDVPPYSHEQGGIVCNVAIALPATVRLGRDGESPLGSTRPAADAALVSAALRRAGLDNIPCSVDTTFPAGAGLGGSSAVGVALAGAIRAWRGDDIDRAAIAEESRRVEVDDLRVAGGRQDHYAAAYGGALALEFGETTAVRRLALSAATIDALERRCVVAYTGHSRISGATITAVLDAYARREPAVMHALARMKDLAADMTRALEAGDIDSLGELTGEHWIHQRSLHPTIPTPLIDEILSRAARAGAAGGKALGASGGGCVLLIAREETIDAVNGAVGALAKRLPIRVDMDGFSFTAES